MLAAACSMATPVSSSSVSRFIGPAGGSVAAADGSGVLIPPGAVSTNSGSSETITVTMNPNVPAPAGVTRVGPPYTLGPEGATFSVPVTVTLAFDPRLLPADSTMGEVVVLTAPAGSADFTPLATVLVDATHVSARTTHFSVFFPGVPEPVEGGTSLTADGATESDATVEPNEASDSAADAVVSDAGVADALLLEAGDDGPQATDVSDNDGESAEATADADTTADATGSADAAVGSYCGTLQSITASRADSSGTSTLTAVATQIPPGGLITWSVPAGQGTIEPSSVMYNGSVDVLVSAVKYTCPAMPGTYTITAIATNEGEAGNGCFDTTGPVSITCAPQAATSMLTPVSPSPTRFAWQTVQTDFTNGGSPCTGRVTLAVSDHAVCYENASDQLVCAGFTYLTTYGATFTSAGQAGVDQVLLSPTMNSATGNGVCIHNVNGQVLCYGDANSVGQFGTGTTGPASTWISWGPTGQTYTRIATGNWQQMCALDAMGRGWCAGPSIFYNLSSPYFPAGTTSVWVPVNGPSPKANDPKTFRASDGQSSCTVTSSGLWCTEVNGQPGAQIGYGTPGTVVSGGTAAAMASDLGISPTRVCWGDSNGQAWCAVGRGPVPNLDTTTEPAFATAPGILYVSTNYYSSDVCAVGSDGSLWCFGDNRHGELGTGNTNPVPLETQVQPAGSVLVTCQ
jgi:hypothetical protein